MNAESTITTMPVDDDDRPAASIDCAQLVLVAVSDDLRVVSSRHRLDEIDEVRFGRGARAAVRSTIDGRRVLHLDIPDARMSASHGRLIRGATSWTLDDPSSKNGAVVDGGVTRRAVVVDGSVIELGHTLFLVRNAQLDANAPLDVVEDALVATPPALSTFDGHLATQFAALAQIAPSNVPVLVRGETGTGKELIARALHELSGRRGPFVAVNCGALPPNLIEAELFGHRRGAFTNAVGERLGLIRSADNGTLFLDEIGELPPTSQAAFLRVLQESEVTPIGGDTPVKVDVRLCAATLRDLEELVEAGSFRRDLYARLYGFSIELPPLRDRRVDLGLLIRRLVSSTTRAKGAVLTQPALRALVRHDWPMNVRELEKVLASAVALAGGKAIDLGHFPEALRRARQSKPAAEAMPSVEPSSQAGLRERLVELLALHGGNVIAVGEAMGTRRTQVYRWIHRFGIKLEEYQR
jgi:transcriptional regulator of acetoin/glycerol metabolism